jgi:hypothetical protein
VTTSSASSGAFLSHLNLLIRSRNSRTFVFGRVPLSTIGYIHTAAGQHGVLFRRIRATDARAWMSEGRYVTRNPATLRWRQVVKPTIKAVMALLIENNLVLPSLPGAACRLNFDYHNLVVVENLTNLDMSFFGDYGTSVSHNQRERCINPLTAKEWRRRNKKRPTPNSVYDQDGYPVYPQVLMPLWPNSAPAPS